MQLDLIKIIAGVGLPLLSTILGLFVGNIIFFDSVLLSLFGSYLCYSIWSIHPAYCLIIAAILCLILFFIQHTQIGFWAIATFLSYCWGFAFAIITFFISGNSVLWFFAVLIFAFVIMLLLHIKANKRSLEK